MSYFLGSLLLEAGSMIIDITSIFFKNQINGKRKLFINIKIFIDTLFEIYNCSFNISLPYRLKILHFTLLPYYAIFLPHGNKFYSVVL